MIPNQWYAVLESSEVKPGKPLGVTRMGEKLVFWRDLTGKVLCLHDTCPHRGVALSHGSVVDGQIQCPFHGFQYDGQGQCCLAPSNGKNAPMPKQIKTGSYPTHEMHGFIFIWWGDAPADLNPPLFFDDLEGMSYASARDPWETHYSRAIENQLDVAHLPFVHYNTIGRGVGTLVDGPWMEWDGQNKFKLYMRNRLDDGSLPRKPEEMPRPQSNFWLEFIFPNLWQNHLGQNAQVVVAFVPVDEANTMMYLRFYQKFLNIPLLRDLLNRASMPFNLRILHQDRTVVETQLPRRSDLKIGEKLVQSDRPIVAYRARRQELIEAAVQKKEVPVQE
jgi:phenylpropionate dioxygenase-like ring-hydroxylating dioxygenase large terminal subunit